jgi:hypothetical protein
MPRAILRRSKKAKPRKYNRKEASPEVEWIEREKEK